jgi:hypothetical protein
MAQVFLVFWSALDGCTVLSPVEGPFRRRGRNRDVSPSLLIRIPCLDQQRRLLRRLTFFRFSVLSHFGFMSEIERETGLVERPRIGAERGVFWDSSCNL